jgi:2'-5' RNA ligase
VRCFIAVGGSPDLGGALAGWLEQTRERFPELSVTPAQNLHLTLSFLGELDDGQVGVATAATEAAAPEAGPGWELGWGEPGAFPGTRRPRVLWLGAGVGADRLGEVHGALVGELAARGLPIDEKPYRPHLTLARVRRPPLPAVRATEVWEWLQAMPAVPSLRVDSLVLFQSTLGKPAAVHTPIKTTPLARVA